MEAKIFVNMPVKNLQKSIAFFEAIGWTFDPMFTNDKGGCLVISEHIYAMLLTEPFLKTFTETEICDTTKYRESILALSVENNQQVDDLVNKAIAAGGTKYTDPQRHGDFSYQWGFLDLDGHQWEVFFMDKSKFPT
jgi:predicted lactoylglutathione lyase